jgi:hypothetical protein
MSTLRNNSEEAAWTSFLLTVSWLGPDELKIARIAFHNGWQARGGPVTVVAAASVLLGVLALAGWIIAVIAGLA